MNQAFKYCTQIRELPDISYWNINKVISFIGIPNKYSLINDLSESSKWSTGCAKNIKDTFKGCW